MCHGDTQIKTIKEIPMRLEDLALDAIEARLDTAESKVDTLLGK